jgi:hypothetical protein
LPVVNPFTIVALPDTQYYSQYAKLAPIFAAQTQWVVNNRVTENVAFVTHPGDIVQNGATGTNQNLTGWHGPTPPSRSLTATLRPSPTACCRTLSPSATTTPSRQQPRQRRDAAHRVLRPATLCRAA